MPKYTVQDNETNKKVTFDWNDDVNPPTDTDIEGIFAEAKSITPPSLGKAAYTGFVGGAKETAAIPERIAYQANQFLARRGIGYVPVDEKPKSWTEAPSWAAETLGKVTGVTAEAEKAAQEAHPIAYGLGGLGEAIPEFMAGGGAVTKGARALGWLSKIPKAGEAVEKLGVLERAGQALTKAIPRLPAELVPKLAVDIPTFAGIEGLKRGEPLQGAAMGAVFPLTQIPAKTAYRILAGGVGMGGLTAIEGGKPEDIALSTALGGFFNYLSPSLKKSFLAEVKAKSDSDANIGDLETTKHPEVQAALSAGAEQRALPTGATVMGVGQEVPEVRTPIVTPVPKIQEGIRIRPRPEAFVQPEAPPAEIAGEKIKREAPSLTDGTRVFETEDGRFLTADGREVGAVKERIREPEAPPAAEDMSKQPIGAPEATGEAVEAKKPIVPTGYDENQKINAITIKEYGELISRGEPEAAGHIETGLASGEITPEEMAHMVRNQEQLEIQKAPKGKERQQVIENIAKIKPDINEALGGTEARIAARNKAIIQSLAKATPEELSAAAAGDKIAIIREQARKAKLLTLEPQVEPKGKPPASTTGEMFPDMGRTIPSGKITREGQPVEKLDMQKEMEAAAFAKKQIPLPSAKKPTTELSLAQWIRTKFGGISDKGMTGEVKRLERMNLIRKGGESYDKIRELAVNEFEGITKDTTLSEFIDLVEQDATAQARKSETGRVWGKAKEPVLPEQPRPDIVLGDYPELTQEGTEFKIDNEKFKVQGRDAEGNLIIKDGVTYNVDPVFGQIPHPDIGSIKPAAKESYFEKENRQTREAGIESLKRLQEKFKPAEAVKGEGVIDKQQYIQDESDKLFQEADSYIPEDNIQKQGNKYAYKLIGSRGYSPAYATKRLAVLLSNTHKGDIINKLESGEMSKIFKERYEALEAPIIGKPEAPKVGGTTLPSGLGGLQTAYEKLAPNIKPTYDAFKTHLHDIGRTLYKEGMKYADFAKGMKAALGDLWDKFKQMINRVYFSVKKAYKESRLGSEQGAVGYDIGEGKGKPTEGKFTESPKVEIPKEEIPKVEEVKSKQDAQVISQSPMDKAAQIFSKLTDRQILERMHDTLTIDPIPFITRVSKEAADAGVRHANARNAVSPIANDLISRAFPDIYKNPEALSKVMDIMNKDNVLAGYDTFKARASEAMSKGDIKEAAKWKQSTDDILAKHDINSYEQEVATAKNTPQIATKIEAWKKEIEPILNELYNKNKRLDPDTPQEGRGKYFGARVNLLIKEKAAELAEKIGDDRQPMPETKIGANYRNPNVKHDPTDIAARFTGDYSTDMKTNLMNVLSHRINETSKLDFYDELVKSGAAIEEKPGARMPKDIQGQEVARLAIRVPETGKDGHTRMVEKSLFVRKDIAREIRDVLATDMPVSKFIGSDVLTQIQLAQIADAVTHIKNIISAVSRALGAGSKWNDIIRQFPVFKTGDAITRIYKTWREVLSDSPEIRKEKADMAAKGLLRPEFPATGIQKITRGQQLIHQVDTTARITLNRFFDNLVERGLQENTETARRLFVNEVGQYNRRLMKPLMRAMKDSGLSPFITAGRNFNRVASRIAFGTPMGIAANKQAELEMRAMHLFGTAMLFTIPMMLNAITTGKPTGRSGTPLGAWDLGTDEADNKHRIIDLAQLSGLRRGLRRFGIEAVIEGERAGLTTNQILGKAFEQAGQTALHPFVGPAPAFIAKGLTGKQLDIRGKMEAQRIPEGGIKQTMENFRAALESQNPLIYSVVRPVLQETGIDKKPDKPYIEELGGTFLKSPYGAFGVKDVYPAKSAAEEMISAFKRDMPVKDPETKQKLRNALNELKAGKPIGELRKKYNLTGLEITLLQRRKREEPLYRAMQNLTPDEAMSVWDVATDEEKKKIRREVIQKIIRSQTLNPKDKRDYMQTIRKGAD